MKISKSVFKYQTSNFTVFVYSACPARVWTLVKLEEFKQSANTSPVGDCQKQYVRGFIWCTCKLADKTKRISDVQGSYLNKTCSCIWMQGILPVHLTSTSWPYITSVPISATRRICGTRLKGNWIKCSPGLPQLLSFMKPLSIVFLLTQ